MSSHRLKGAEAPLTPELEDRIAILRDNIRQLVEQAAGAAGSENEERAADRIAQQSAELDRLVAERDALVAKQAQTDRSRS
jgi:uncharacterized small protein (DUF1192 family)